MKIYDYGIYTVVAILNPNRDSNTLFKIEWLEGRVDLDTDLPDNTLCFAIIENGLYNQIIATSLGIDKPGSRHEFIRWCKINLKSKS